MALETENKRQVASLENIPVSARPFHVMTKPAGPACNIACRYCFYLEKEAIYPEVSRFRMPPETLELYIKEYIQAQPGPQVVFAWQGGEPTLLGVDYFRKIIEFQRKYAQGKTIENAFQTNGTLLNDEWGEFLATHNFLVGLSIDGPRDCHDAYRVDRKGRSTFAKVMEGVKFLKKHGVRFNTLTCVQKDNSRKPLEVYRFLKEIGSGYIQFIPIVERNPNTQSKKLGLSLATPPECESEDEDAPTTTWSVRPSRFGNFLIDIFDYWVSRDIGQVFVQEFDVALGNWAGQGGGLCVHSETCGTAVAMEHNGDVFSCDHFVYPQYRLGNIHERSLADMINDPRQIKFGLDKKDKLPGKCRRCPVRFACHGGCPKHRFLQTEDGEPGLNYLCAGYEKFFQYISPYMDVMCWLLQQQRAPASIMELTGRKGFSRKDLLKWMEQQPMHSRKAHDPR